MNNMKDQLNHAAQALLCDVRGCTGGWQQRILLHEQDFYFCQHHYNELEPTFAGLVKDNFVSAMEQQVESLENA